MVMQINSLAELSVKQLRRAVAIREKIDRLQRELDSLSGGGASGPGKAARPRKGKMSAAAKARISKAMKARWARVRAQNARK